MEKISKNNKVKLAALASSLFISCALAAPAFAETPTPSTINISTSATVKQVPDIAIISTGVVTQDKNAKSAMTQNSVQMNNVFDAIKALGIAEKDIKTSGVSLSPQYTYLPNKPATIKGYEASNNVTIKVRDLSKVGNVLDALVASGSNNISGPNFTIEDPDKALDSAREEAMKKAIARANVYAKAAGMKVKRVISISESGGYSPAPVMYEKSIRSDVMAAPAPTPVAPGEIEMSISVNTSFELAN